MSKSLQQLSWPGQLGAAGPAGACVFAHGMEEAPRGA